MFISYSSLFSFFSDTRGKIDKIKYGNLISKGEKSFKANKVCAIDFKADRKFQLQGQVQPSLKSTTKAKKKFYEVKVINCKI